MLSSKSCQAQQRCKLVLSGDFCQLPPVPDKSGTGAQIPATFAFDAKSWSRCVGPPVILTRVFRQKDQKFVDMLNAMRYGRMNAETTKAFRDLSRPVTYTDGIEPTELYPTRQEVDSANSHRLKQLPENSRLYHALDLPGRDEEGHKYPPLRIERALRDVIVPKVLALKVGAQVMLVKVRHGTRPHPSGSIHCATEHHPRPPREWFYRTSGWIPQTTRRARHGHPIRASRFAGSRWRRPLKRARWIPSECTPEHS
ncbi:hypothetical protein GY45DRAFT_1238914 [Cubamyces sp. BRFM 1775]|nr:hypothetical protein GY45DRAFT_1238914 [Cubamyces sp. BRFM 1775]